MKLSTLGWITAAALVVWYLKHRPTAQNAASTQLIQDNVAGTLQKIDPATPATFTISPELSPVANTAITEAAYHQQPTVYGAAFGADELQNDEEVITLQ